MFLFFHCVANTKSRSHHFKSVMVANMTWLTVTGYLSQMTMVSMDTFRFVLDQQQLDFYSASSLKQHSAGRHVVPFGHIALIPSQPVFAFSP